MELLALECQDVEMEAVDDHAVIKGMAFPYGVIGSPSRNGDPVKAVITRDATLEYSDSTVFCQSHEPTSANTMASMSVEAPNKGSLSFEESDRGLLFEAHLDPEAPLSGQIYSNLKNNVIEGNVSIGLKVQKSHTETVTFEDADVEVIYVDEARVDHLAFLGNTKPAFSEAVSIAAENAAPLPATIRFYDADDNLLVEYLPKIDLVGEEITTTEEATEEILDNNSSDTTIGEIEMASVEAVQAAMDRHNRMISYIWKGNIKNGRRY